MSRQLSTFGSDYVDLRFSNNQKLFRWLVQGGRLEEARNVLEKLRRKGDAVDKVPTANSVKCNADQTWKSTVCLKIG